jgi:hypothetical protein
VILSIALRRNATRNYPMTGYLSYVQHVGDMIKHLKSVEKNEMLQKHLKDQLLVLHAIQNLTFRQKATSI